ncbi:MAG: hypothetical protein ABFR82_10235 [Nitrospirota bacterium]
MSDSLGQCNICKKEYTTTHVEAKPGVQIYVCPNCLEKSKDNFIWVCTNCGKSHSRPKKMILNRLAHSGLENANLLSEGVPLIQGIDICIECDPEGILEYVMANIPEYEELHS